MSRFIENMQRFSRRLTLKMVDVGISFDSLNMSKPLFWIGKGKAVNGEIGLFSCSFSC